MALEFVLDSGVARRQRVEGLGSLTEEWSHLLAGYPHSGCRAPEVRHLLITLPSPTSPPIAHHYARRTTAGLRPL